VVAARRVRGEGAREMTGVRAKQTGCRERRRARAWRRMAHVCGSRTLNLVRKPVDNFFMFDFYIDMNLSSHLILTQGDMSFKFST
jgi:hypothetical protein